MQHGSVHEGLGPHEQRSLRGEGGPQEGLGLRGPKGGRRPSGTLLLLLLEGLQAQGAAFHLAPMPCQAIGSVAKLGVDEDLAPGAIPAHTGHGTRVVEGPLLLLLRPKLHQARPGMQGKRRGHPRVNVLLLLLLLWGVGAVASAGRSAASR